MIFVPIMAVLMMVLTWLLGWWGVLVAALLAGFLHYRVGGGGRQVALAAALSWGALLVIDATTGDLGVAVATLGGILRVPGALLVLLTIAFPALLAWSAATVAAEARRLFARRDAVIPS